MTFGHVCLYTLADLPISIVHDSEGQWHLAAKCRAEVSDSCPLDGKPPSPKTPVLEGQLYRRKVEWVGRVKSPRVKSPISY